MQPIIDAQSARDELLRRIGRNVLNFQYLEATLRSMIPILSNRVTFKELRAGQVAVSDLHKKSTLGKLANAYHQKIYASNVADKSVSDEVSPEPGIAVSVNLSVAPEKAAERWRALVKLIEERNRLIHTDLLSVDLDSREECEELSARLDEQYTRIRRYLDHLNSLRTNFQEIAAEFRRLLESGELLALLNAGLIKSECDDP